MTEQALDDLYLQYYRTIPQKLQSEFKVHTHEAEDAFTDAFIIFKRRLKEEALKDQNFEGYVYVIAKRILMRAKKRDQQTIFPDLDTLVHLWDKIKQDNDLDEYEQKYALMVNCLKQSVAQLNERCQLLIEAYYFKMTKLKDLVVPLNYASYDAIRSANLACKNRLRILSKACIENNHG